MTTLETTTSAVTPMRRLLSLNDAVIYSATSRAKLYREKSEGRIEFLKIDGSTRVEVAELDRWIDSKAQAAA